MNHTFVAVVRTTADGRANRVRTARVLAGLTQAQLAVAAGVSRQTVVAIEAGDYAPSVYLALRLAARLRVTVEDLFGPVEATAAGPGDAAAGGEMVPPEARKGTR